MNKLSQHLTYKEATITTTKLPNSPNDIQLANMEKVALAIFEPIRRHFNVPIYVTSFFRSKEVSEAIGGATNSQHGTGQAIDIDAHHYGKITNKQVFDYVKANLDYDQLIAEKLSDNSEEPSWIHISYVSADQNRKEILVHESVGGTAKYCKYDPEKGLHIRSYR